MENRREGMLSESRARRCRVRAGSHLNEVYVAEHREYCGNNGSGWFGGLEVCVSLAELRSSTVTGQTMILDEAE